MLRSAGGHVASLVFHVFNCLGLLMKTLVCDVWLPMKKADGQLLEGKLLLVLSLEAQSAHCCGGSVWNHGVALLLILDRGQCNMSMPNKLVYHFY